MTTPRDGVQAVRDESADSQLILLRIIAGLLIGGAAWQLAPLLVPFFLAVVLAITLSPVATRMTRAGLPNVLASVLCTLFVAAILALAAGLIVFQAGSIIGDSDKYLKQFSGLLADVTARTGGDRMVETFGLLKTDGEAAPAAGDGGPAARPDGPGAGVGGGADAAEDPAAAWDRFLRRNVRALGRWVARRAGGPGGRRGGGRPSSWRSCSTCWSPARSGSTAWSTRRPCSACARAGANC
jgi:hypothetical protein